MRALQLHYTSCRKGQTGSAGFQFRSCSEGVAAEDQREVGELGNYQVSRDLDPDASEDIIARQFPVLFRFRCLGSGRPAVIRSKYTGRDYTGRSGNFFAHSLLLEPDRLDLWPIDLYEWDGWIESLSENEDNEDPPPWLPPVDLATVTPALSFGFPELRTFLSEGKENTRLLADMIKAVFAREGSSRSLLLRARFFDGLYWIACIQKAFPRALAPYTSFSSYQFESRHCETINLSVGDTNFTFDDNEMKFQFFGFDLETGRQSEIPDLCAEYADTISDWMASGSDHLVAFHEFMRSFSYDRLDPALVQGLRLYELKTGLLSSPSGEVLSAMVAFAGEHAAPHCRGEFLEIFSGSLADLRGVGSVEDYGLLVGFLAEGARETGYPSHRVAACEAWLQMFEDLVVARGADPGEVQDAKHRLVEQVAENRGELAEMFLVDERLRRLAVDLREKSDDVLSAILVEAMDSLETLGAAASWRRRTCSGLLCGLVSAARDPEPLVARLFGVIEPNAEALVEACCLLADDMRGAAKDDQRASEALILLGQCLGSRLRPESGELVEMVRVQLDREALYPVLCGEWQQLLETAADKVALYRDYRSAVLPKLPAYAESCLAWVMAAYLQSLSQEAAARQALEWIRGGELSLLGDPQTIGWAVELANGALPLTLEPDVVREDSALVSEAARERQIELCPDRTLLWDMVESPELLDRPDWGTERQTLPRHLARLPAAEYDAFLRAVLPAALATCSSAAAHGHLLEALLLPAGAPSFMDAYEASLRKSVEVAGEPAAKPAMTFWLTRAGAGEHKRASLADRSRALEILAGVLADMPKVAREELRHSMKKDPEVSGRASKAWEKLQKRAGRFHSPMSKLGRALFRRRDVRAGPGPGGMEE